MFKIVICLFVVAVTSVVNGASIGRLANSTVTEKPVIEVLKFERDQAPNGNFSFSYEGSDQSTRNEEGHLENAGTADETLEVSGSYRYIDADGQEIEVHYTAGKNGFVPVGTNIPKEISLLAKAAADLPNYSEEEEQELRLKQRRSRAQKEETKNQEPLKVVESQIVPVQVLIDEQPVKVEQLEKSEKVEKVEKVESESA
ncbi:larval cuticle protein LCP-17 [Drosophila innubila]|uniref:larval cuticle protein LCP-17 n=1 Tax=Drosophila innubila TaxID=198719 RepID=UPI00148BDDA2|nr:larval cuticle protein LCP-17 [Drosophila innubila]